MIRKLRWKFSAIMMTIVAFLLAVIFITLYYTTKANYVQRSMGTLHSAMLENYPGSMREQAGQPSSAGQRPPSRPRRQELPLMVVEYKAGQLYCSKEPASRYRKPGGRNPDIPGGKQGR